MHPLKSVKKDKKLIVGVGSALVDILAHEEDDFLTKTGAVKGGMTYVSKEFIEKVNYYTEKEELVKK